MLASNTRYCEIVKISYDLKFVASPEGFHLNVDMNFPITIVNMDSAQTGINAPVATAPSDDLRKLIKTSFIDCSAHFILYFYIFKPPRLMRQWNG